MMSNISQIGLISQMQALESMSKGQMISTPQNLEASKSFGSMMQQAINQINETQTQANDLAKAFEMGDKSVGLSEVMVAMQKSKVSFQALTEVRNKILSAYQDVMNMPV